MVEWGGGLVPDYSAPIGPVMPGYTAADIAPPSGPNGGGILSGIGGFASDIMGTAGQLTDQALGLAPKAIELLEVKQGYDHQEKMQNAQIRAFEQQARQQDRAQRRARRGRGRGQRGQRGQRGRRGRGRGRGRRQQGDQPWMGIPPLFLIGGAGVLAFLVFRKR